MSAIPFVINLGPFLAEKIIRLGWIELPTAKHAPAALPYRDHLVIIGFGVNGRNLARAARVAGIQYVIIETNPETVRNEKKRGEPIYFGDASRKIILERTGVPHARVVVIAISDPVASRSITQIIRDLSQEPYIITRTRFIQEVKPLYDLGANDVIPEEFETSVEIFTRVLRKYLIPHDDIEQFITEVRSDNYEMLRTLSPSGTCLIDLKLHVPNLEIETFRIRESSPIADKTLAELDLRKKYGVTLLVIQRGSETLTNPAGDTRLMVGDVLVLLGSSDNLTSAVKLF
jgi:CPA2 family monovalent cation:H+ antiporter-2